MAAALCSSSSGNGIAALLDLPAGTELNIDGHAVVLKRDDFVGFDQIPGGDVFHLITVRSAARATGDSSSAQPTALTIGLVVLQPDDVTDWIIARRYDSQTEELSSVAPDRNTTENLLHQIRSGQMEPQRVIPYGRVLSAAEIQSWRCQTAFVSSHLLQRRGLANGDKIVPGSYDDGDAKSLAISEAISDGITVDYPPIPYVEPGSGHHHTRHVGTKRYLSKLFASERTSLFLGPTKPADTVLGDVLDRHYRREWTDLLGDLQLSYVVFLHVHCLSSLEHWRDLVAMLSVVSSDSVSKNLMLYTNLLQVLSTQLMTMDNDFFEDIEYSENNFFGPALRRLCSVCSQVSHEAIQRNVSSMTQILSSRFPALEEPETAGETAEGNTDRHLLSPVEPSQDHSLPRVETMSDNDSDSEDGPVIVASEEVEESLARISACTSGRTQGSNPREDYPPDLRQRFPLLFASMHDEEDLLMACARILDDAVDVSLVREAATYLEEVEANKK